MVHACVKAGKAIEIMRYLRAKSLSTLSSEGCHREQISRISTVISEAQQLHSLVLTVKLTEGLQTLSEIKRGCFEIEIMKSYSNGV